MIEIIEKIFENLRNPDLARYCECDTNIDGSSHNAKMKCYVAVSSFFANNF